MVVVVVFEFNDFVVIGEVVCQVNGVYGGFGIGVYYLYYIYGWYQFGYQGCYFYFYFGWCVKVQVVGCCFDYCIVDSWVVVVQYYWISGIDIIDIGFFIYVIEVSVICVFDKQWCVVDVGESVYW